MASGSDGAVGVGFLRSDRALARALHPMVRFLHVEAAGALLLLAGAAVALVWANSPWRAGYEALWSTEVTVRVGSVGFSEDLQHVVNDALMALFFFVVGVEIKREVVHGELRDPRTLALPGIAAVGGMVAPALIFVAFTAGGPGADGWGVPIATDIAFAVGVLALLGRRLPTSVKVLLLTLAIVDDIGGIIVIAVFYGDSISVPWLIAAVALAVAVAVLHRLSVVYLPVFVFLGVAMWFAAYQSGVHPTIAGVVMGLLIPARARVEAGARSESLEPLHDDRPTSVDDVRAAARTVRESVSACDRSLAALHPWSSFVIVPLFALANAGVELTGHAVTSPSPVFAGVFVGLVVGKLVGISAFSWLAVRAGIARLPSGVRWIHVVGVAAVAGIGFTVSLFIADASFTGDMLGEAKVAILAASVTAAAIGLIILRSARPDPADAAVVGMQNASAEGTFVSALE